MGETPKHFEWGSLARGSVAGMIGFSALQFAWRVAVSYFSENINLFPWKDSLFWISLVSISLNVGFFSVLRTRNLVTRPSGGEPQRPSNHEPNRSQPPNSSSPKEKLGVGHLLISTHDHLLIGNELQSNAHFSAYEDKEKLNSVSVVAYTFRNLSKVQINRAIFRLIKNREGRILEVFSKRADYPQYKSKIKIETREIIVTLENMKAREFFEVEILTDGLREADFRLEAVETDPEDLFIKIEPQDYWIPSNPTTSS